MNCVKITQAFHLLLGFAENQIVFWDFKIRNSVRITEGSDNGDSDNRGPTVYIYIIKQALPLTSFFVLAFAINIWKGWPYYIA